MVRALIFVLLLPTHALVLGQSLPADAEVVDDPVRVPHRINQLQLLGTHNSYHLAPDPVALSVVRFFAPSEADAIDCSQRTLTEQLNVLGCRHFELDLYLDPLGKLYRQPSALQVAKAQHVDVPAFDPEDRLAEPGIKVLHSPDFDFRTTVYTLKDGLREIRRWSDQNQTHVPVFVLLELKSDSFSPATHPIQWDETGFEELERTILEVFDPTRILTPDDVRGDRDTLRDAVEGIGWPTVDLHRGKVAFLLDNEDQIRDGYLKKSEILAGRLLFASVSATHPAAAWMKRNDPVESYDEIRQLVSRGFLVRTRADSGTTEARNNDTTRRDKAILSGAQLISTDFPEPDPRFSDYRVTLPYSTHHAPW
ncbi:MAG: hypothetical protein JNL58_14275 [Planctomyces sp.]|nr:hypothetical protein [Planctomyces sp.]